VDTYFEYDDRVIFEVARDNDLRKLEVGFPTDSIDPSEPVSLERAGFRPEFNVSGDFAARPQSE